MTSTSKEISALPTLFETWHEYDPFQFFVLNFYFSTLISLIWAQTFSNDSRLRKRVQIRVRNTGGNRLLISHTLTPWEILETKTLI